MPRISNKCADEYAYVDEYPFKDSTENDAMFECFGNAWEIRGERTYADGNGTTFTLHWDNKGAKPSEGNQIVVSDCFQLVHLDTGKLLRAWTSGESTMWCSLKIHESADPEWFKALEEPEGNVEEDDYYKPFTNIPKKLSAIVDKYNLNVNAIHRVSYAEGGYYAEGDKVKHNDHATLGVGFGIANCCDDEGVKSLDGLMKNVYGTFEVSYDKFMGDVSKAFNIAHDYELQYNCEISFDGKIVGGKIDTKNVWNDVPSSKELSDYVKQSIIDARVQKSPDGKALVDPDRWKVDCVVTDF